MLANSSDITPEPMKVVLLQRSPCPRNLRAEVSPYDEQAKPIGQASDSREGGRSNCATAADMPSACVDGDLHCLRFGIGSEVSRRIPEKKRTRVFPHRLL